MILRWWQIQILLVVALICMTKQSQYLFTYGSSFLLIRSYRTRRNCIFSAYTTAAQRQDGNSKKPTVVFSTQYGGDSTRKHSLWIPNLPHVPTLDTSGLLPPSAYYSTTVANSTMISSGIENKPTSRIQIAWDISSLEQPSSLSSGRGAAASIEITKEDIGSMVSNMQHSFDHGLTTFQLKPYSTPAINQLQYDIYQAFIDQTPNSIMEQQSQIVVPLRIEDVLTLDSTTTDKSVSTKSVRTRISTLLNRLGTDCLDNIQIQFPIVVENFDFHRESTKTTVNSHLTSQMGFDSRQRRPHQNARVDDRYYFDLINELQELVRDGYIRSISTKDISYSNEMYKQLEQMNLHTLFNTNQVDTNLLNVSPLIVPQSNRAMAQSSSNDGVHVTQHVVASNPFAGGWLVDRYCNTQQRPTSQWLRSLSPKEQWNWDRNIVHSWIPTRQSSSTTAESDINHDFNLMWNIYQTEFMDPIRRIARKHDVSVASVVLRWTLQQHEHYQSSCSSSMAVYSSTVTSCRLLPEHLYWDTHRPYTNVDKRLQQLRETFRFKLDDDDIDQLWELSSGKSEFERQTDSSENNKYYDDSFLDDNIKASSTRLFIPRR